MASWFDALKKTRSKIADSLSRVFSGSAAVDEDLAEELEELLLSADVSVRLVTEWLEELEDLDRGTSRREHMRKILKAQLQEPPPEPWLNGNKPVTILIVGTNGSGKTTSCAKLAHQMLQQGRKPMLAAADTFRAAGSEQLKIWAKKVGSDVVAGVTGADAAAVAFDALSAAISREADVLFIDTAGRMHTKQPLMQELDKVQRALTKKKESAPEEIWIVLDASLGQNAIMQAKTFNETVPISGVILTKLDGSAKAGFIFSIAKELDMPIRFVGLGESEDDLVRFDPDAFIDALLGEEDKEDLPL